MQFTKKNCQLKEDFNPQYCSLILSALTNTGRSETVFSFTKKENNC